MSKAFAITIAINFRHNSIVGDRHTAFTEPPVSNTTTRPRLLTVAISTHTQKTNMNENTAPTAPTAKSPPAEEDVDGMRSILAAAIGLTSLGTPATQGKESVKPSAAAIAAMRMPPVPRVANNEHEHKRTTASNTGNQSSWATQLPQLDSSQLLKPGIDGGSDDHVLQEEEMRMQMMKQMHQQQQTQSQLQEKLKASFSNTNSSSLLPLYSPEPTRRRVKNTAADTIVQSPGGPDTMNITLNFPEILYEIISDPKNSNVISWLQHGRGFVIHDKNKFASQILPHHFDGAKFTSFTRRLKRWNFERVPRGPEMGAYYNRYFIRGRPDLVPSMMYGIDAGEMEPTELPKDEPRGPMTEGEVSIEENKKHKDELKKNGGGNKGSEGASNKNKQKREKTKKELHDDAVVAAAMEVHRKQQREMRERRVLEQNEEMDRKVSEAMEEAHQREPRSSGQSYEMMNPKDDQRQDVPTPYNPTDYDIAASNAMSHSPKDQFAKRQLDEEIRDRIHANLRQQQMMQAKAMELQLQQEQQQQASSPKRQKQYQKPPNGMLHTSEPGYKRPSRRKADVLKRKQQQEELQQLQARQQQIQQEEMQLQARQKQLQKGPRHLSQGSSQDSSTGQQGMHNQADYLYRTQVRRNLADMQTGEMPSMKMLENSRPNISLPMGQSSTMSNTMEMLRSQHLNIISPPENSEQRQCLNDIERKILSEMSYPMLPLANPNSSLYTGRNNMRERMDRMMMGRGGHNSMMSSSGDNNNMDDLQRNHSRLMANQEMISKILASSKTHEEIMMMAARDLQSRGIGGGSRDQVNQMIQQKYQQRNFQHSQFDESPHQQRQSMQQQFSQQQQRHRLNDDEMMMMAAQREQHQRQRLDNDEMMMLAAQRGHQHQHNQYEPLSPRSMRMQQIRTSSGTSSNPPSRATRLHEMMLRELEDKVERETILAKAAAVQAAGLRDNLAQDDDDYVDDGFARRGLKRKNSRPAAA